MGDLGLQEKVPAFKGRSTGGGAKETEAPRAKRTAYFRSEKSGTKRYGKSDRVCKRSKQRIVSLVQTEKGTHTQIPDSGLELKLR